LLFFFLIYIINTAWVDKIQSELISGKGFKGYDFNTGATEIRFSLKCSANCDMFLLNPAQLENLRNNRQFTYYWSRTNARESGSQLYSNINNIKNTVIVVIVNAYSSGSIRGDFNYGWYINNAPVSPWTTQTHTNQLIQKGQFKGYDFPVNSAIIRFSIKSNLPCDIYLMEEKEIENLREGRTFAFLYSKLSTNEVLESTYSDTTKITNKVVALAVNKNYDQISVDYVIEYQLATSALSVIIIAAIVAGVCCLFCCCGCFSSATYGGRRYYLHNHGYHNITYNDSGVHGGYGGGGNSYSGSYSDGGNSYSGSTSGGGNSYSSGGGNSYSSGGGNSYSSGGGNSYN